MQFMYLRRKGKKNNPGRHPIGMVGVQKMPDETVEVTVQLIHSKDRFEKKMGRDLLAKKIYRERTARLTPDDFLTLQLHEILPAGFGNLLDNYPRHQEILNKLIWDEMKGGSWSTANKVAEGFERFTAQQ